MKNYKLTKTIRFKLEADEKNISDIKKEIKSIEAKSNEFELANFVTELNNYIANIKAYLFYQRKDGLSAIKDKMTIKNEWLRQYAKQELVEFKVKTQKSNYTGNKRREQITISEISELSQKITKAFDELVVIYTELADSASLELNERARKAKIGLLLKRLCAKNTLPLLSSLIDNTSDKNETDDLSIRLKKQAIKINAQLLVGIRMYLPEQSGGLPITKASFNYYTINKKPVDFKERIEDLEKKLEVQDLEKLNIYFDKKKRTEKDYLEKKIFKLLEADVQKSLPKNQTLCLGEAPMIKTDSVSLRQFLKNIKAEQKKQFSELMQNNIPYEELEKSNLYLLNNIKSEQFTAYKEKTKKLEEIATKLSNQNLSEDVKKKLRSDKEKIAKERGGIMKDNFFAWKSFANFYRSIAQKHGRILSQLKDIEKEKAESQLLKYWALIVEENNTHKLILIPKEKAGECKKWLETQIYIQSTNNPKIIWLESLTYRSLRKLCFGFVENGNNEFNQNIKDLLPKDENGYTIKGEFDFKGDEQKKIKFYRRVLSSKYAQQVLDIPAEQIEEDIIDQSFDSLDDFKIALEKICYSRHVVCPSDIVEKLKHYDAQIFEITSLDLKNPENVKEKQDRFEHFDKHHTQIWKNFWTGENEKNNFNIRLNPEITITYRQPKQSRIEKYGEQKSDKKNRYLHPQFTLITTISEHSNSPTKILSFITDEEFKTSVNKFNKNLKKENIKFALGIDNNEVEFSTLGVYFPAFAKTTNEEKIAELKQVKKYGFEVLTINDLNYKETDYNNKERKIIQNPSYFLKKENYMRTFNKSEQDYEKMFAEQFEKKHLLTLDLITAKVICGHIVANGDIHTHFNLQMRDAQRLIYKMNDHTQEETIGRIKDFKIKETEAKNKVYVNIDANFIDGGFKSVFEIRPEFSNIKLKEEILSEIKTFNTRSISNEELDLKINHLKRSIISNAIGVIDFIYKQYKERWGGEGLIVKEGFDTKEVDKGIEKFNGNIYRILERKLYQKFQNYGLVPPIKSLMAVRADGIKGDKKAILRLGNIAFIDPTGTSQECPVCSEGELDHTTTCSKNCGFESNGIMHSNDGIAGFNIAKRGFENFY